MSKYLKGNMGLLKWFAIEGIVIRKNEIYAICREREKEVLINRCKDKAEAELFLKECALNIEKENTISLQNPISLIEKKY